MQSLNFSKSNSDTTDGFFRSEKSYWHATQNEKFLAELKHETDTSTELPGDAQIIIIGAGFAGLSTAIEIKQRAPASDVLVLEKNIIGFGASGRNGGLMSPLPAPIWLMSTRHDTDHQWATMELNRRVAKTATWLKNTIGHDEVRNQPLTIQATGSLTSAALNRIAFDLDHMGIDSNLSQRKNSKNRAALTLAAHTVHPYKLTHDLSSYAKKMGVEICQGIDVKSIEVFDTGARLTYAQHSNSSLDTKAKTHSLKSIHAKTSVLCTNAYTGDIKTPERVRAKPVYNFMVATRPMDSKTLQSLKNIGNFTVELNHAYAFYRFHDNRLIFGGIEKLKNRGGRDFDVPCRLIKQLKKLIERSLPGYSKIEIDQAWSGKYHMTPVDLPVIRRAKSSPSLVFNVGYGGTGVALTLACAPWAAATALAEPLKSPEDKRLFEIFANTRLPISAAARFGLGCLYATLRAPFTARITTEV